MRPAEAASDGDGRWTAALAALPLLLFTYMPRPPISGTQFLAYPALGGGLAAVVLLLFGRWRWLDARLWRTLLLLLLANIVTAASFLLNAGALRTTGVVELFRAGLVALFLLYGYVVGRSGDEAAVPRGLLRGAYIVLAGQAVIAAFQILGIPLFDPIYTGEKSRPLGSLVRATGSLANPNTFAWIVAQTGIIAFMLGRGRARFVCLAGATLLVLLSGSRTMLLTFPFMLLVASLAGRRAAGGGALRYAALAGGIATVFVLVVIALAEHLPYLAQLRLIFTTGSIRSINSMNARILVWNEVFRQFSANGWPAWLVGLGSRPSTAVLDNDYLYVLFRLGFAGLLVHVALYGHTLAVLWTSRRQPASMIGIVYIASALVVGLVSETLGGWNYPLLLFFLAGLGIGATSVRPGGRGAVPEPAGGPEGAAPRTRGR